MSAVISCVWYFSLTVVIPVADSMLHCASVVTVVHDIFVKYHQKASEFNWSHRRQVYESTYKVRHVHCGLPAPLNC